MAKPTRVFRAPNGWQIDRDEYSGHKDASGVWYVAVRARKDGRAQMFVWRFGADNNYLDTVWESSGDDNGDPRLELTADGNLTLLICNERQNAINVYWISQFVRQA